MKVKHKVLIIVGSSVLFLIAVTYIIFYTTYFGYIDKQQQHEISTSFEVVDFIISNETKTLQSTLKDWAYWDDTYRFIQGSNLEYIESNLNDNTMQTLSLNMMVFLDANRNIFYDIQLGLEQNESEKIKKTIIMQNNKLNAEGLFIIEDKVFIIAKSYISDSNKMKKSNGSLVMVRQINEDLMKYIKNVAKVDLKFSKYNSSFEEPATVHKMDKHKEFLESTKVVNDINGDANIAFSIVKDISDYKVINSYFNNSIKLFLFLIVIIIFIDEKIVNKLILSKIEKLGVFTSRVAETRDTALSLKMPGSDELSNLASSLNRMLSELDTAHKDMRETDHRFRLIMEATSDGVLDFYPKIWKIYISPEWKSSLGYIEKDGDEPVETYISRIHPECMERLENKYHEVVSGETEIFDVEYRMIKASGDIMWVQQRGKIAEKNEKGEITRIVSTLTDITYRKKHEEEILFLSYSDKLTGLKNRAYMEKLFETLDKEDKSDYSIIMGDLNGLKIINDTLGHKEGDRLLCIVSDVFREVCEADDVVSRWGGDEFVVLVKNKDDSYISSLVSVLKENIEKATLQSCIISIAVGYAKKDEAALQSEDVMSVAEERMYRNKLMKDKSARNATITSLQRTLHEKHSETEEHTMRIKKLSLKLGNKLELTQDKLDEIELLALLHDIGKIGIPEHILMKPGKLTNEEWEIMKNHSEIGYRIAQSAPELSHIAYEILCHHERYDGTGYPSGLRGEEIPILSRIINIIDSYDVMTHLRIYKDAMSKGYALEELIRCAGTQFDPFIVYEFISLLKEKDYENEILIDKKVI